MTAPMEESPHIVYGELAWFTGKFDQRCEVCGARGGHFTNCPKIPTKEEEE